MHEDERAPCDLPCDQLINFGRRVPIESCVRLAIRFSCESIALVFVCPAWAPTLSASLSSSDLHNPASLRKSRTVVQEPDDTVTGYEVQEQVFGTRAWEPY